MLIKRISAIAAVALLAAAPAHASTFVSVFNFGWSGASGPGGPWGITASSEFINPFPDASVKFDPINGEYRVEGRVDIAKSPGDSFTRADVIALNFDVITNGYRIASYSFAKDDLRIGIMSGSIIDMGEAGFIAELTAFRLMQPNAGPFEQVFGCPTINDGCGTALWLTPLPAYESGNPVPPNGSSPYGVVVLTDGRSDPCCAARGNTLRFYYLTPEEALASFRLTFDREKSYFLDDVPEGLPAPIPLPAALPMLMGAVGALGLASRRSRRTTQG
jgi:hypothetical protein